MPDVITVCKPENMLPVIFDSPHSGRDYPDDFNFACSLKDLRRCEDEYLDEIFSFAPNLKAGLVCALFPRSYIDVNRAIDDIDPLVVHGVWDAYETIKPSPTIWARSGIGLIRRLVRPDLPLYKAPLQQSEILQRIDIYYKPFHEALSALIDEAHERFGSVWHVSCHSMPDHTAKPERPIGLHAGAGKSTDFCIGDRGGTTSSPVFTRSLRDFIKGLGYSVTINDPFRGVEIVERYGDPLRGIHSMQLEINKALYLNEATSTKSKNYDRLVSDVQKIGAFICDYAKKELKISS